MNITELDSEIWGLYDKPWTKVIDRMEDDYSKPSSPAWEDVNFYVKRPILIFMNRIEIQYDIACLIKN
jgi:hypothetical protein